jgi:N-acyl-D-amino-acid deacylase
MESTILIKNGTLVSDVYNCVKRDVLIQGKRIARIGNNLRVQSPTRIIDAHGLYVSPGFVNIHGHDDFYLAGQDQSYLESICFQGVTTSVSGNCGISNFPFDGNHTMEIDSYQGFLHYEQSARSFTSLADFIEAAKGRMTFNMVPLVGHGTLRILANGFKPSLGKTAMEKMERLFREFIEQGGYGLSSGLMYMPGTFSETNELIDLLNSIPDKSNLLYASHLRGYSDTFLMAVQEAIDIARATGVRVECSHLGPFGTQYKKELRIALDLLERADEEGLQIGFDTLAYCGGSTTIMAIVPPWFYTDGIDTFLGRLRNDEDFFKRVIEAMETYVPTWPSWEGAQSQRPLEKSFWKNMEGQ